MPTRFENGLSNTPVALRSSWTASQRSNSGYMRTERAGQRVHLAPVRAAADVVQRLLVGAEQLEAALGVGRLDQLDHHRVAPVHHRHVGGRGLDEAQGDEAGVVDAAELAVAGGDLDQPVDRLGEPVERHGQLRRVGRQQVGGADVEHLVGRPGVLVVGEEAEQLVGAAGRRVGQRVEHQVAEERDDLRAAGELEPPVAAQPVARALAPVVLGAVAPAGDAAVLSVEVQVHLVVAVGLQHVGNPLALLRPGRQLAHLGQPVLGLDLEGGRVDDAHAAHGDDRRLEHAVAALDADDPPAARHELERADGVGDRAELDARSRAWRWRCTPATVWAS